MARLLPVYLLFCVGILSCTHEREGVNYYFDADRGVDSNSGTSAESPFKSLGRIKSLSLKPGDSVLLRSGVIFDDSLFISARGSTGRPVVLGKYGGEERPHVRGNGTSRQAVYVYNSEYFVIRDIEISNTAAKPVDKLHGLVVELHNYGKAKDIIVDNIYVHDLRATLIDAENSSGSGIALNNYRDNGSDSVSSHFDGLTVQNCYIRDCDFGGISMWGNWERKRWDPNLKVVIRKNVIDGAAGHGIVPVACEGPLVEYNVVKNSPQQASDPDGIDGIWPWSCDNSVVQYNTVSDIKSQWDAYGFDADYNCSNSLFQYNLSYNNKGGFLLVCNAGGWPADWSVGNTGTIIKYNVSINDGLRDYIGKNSAVYFSPVIHCTGSIKNTLIENNLLYAPRKKDRQTDRTILHLNNWGKGFYPDSTFFRNNYIFAEEQNLAVNAENSANHYFSDNYYVGELSVPDHGFVRHSGKFDRSLWYNENDANWARLVNFLKDKTIPFEGKETPVLDIIGYNHTGSSEENN